MHRKKILVFLGLFVYQVSVALFALSTHLDLFVFSILFMLIPALVLVHYVPFSKKTLFSILLFSIAATITWEVCAYLNGVWEETSTFGIRILGLFPIEIFFWAFSYLFAMIMVYEYLFDNKKNVWKGMNYKLWSIVLLTLSGVWIAIAYTLFFNHITIPFAYTFLIVCSFITLIIGIRLRKGYSLSLFKKGIIFSAVMVIPSLLHEYVSVENTHWVFSNTPHYLYPVNFFGNVVPFEEFLFFIIVPFWVVTIYELYLDDCR